MTLYTTRNRKYDAMEPQKKKWFQNVQNLTTTHARTHHA